MASVHCISSTGCREAVRKGRATQPTKIAALTFNKDGTLAAYAVRRSSTLPIDGAEDPAHSIRVAQTRTAHAGVDAAQEGVESFAQWTVVQVLTGVHTAPITALSWSPTTGALVSASADRCAYVWTPQSPANNTEEQSREAKTASNGCLIFDVVPQLVMLSADVLQSPTVVAWSAEGNKVYLGTAGGSVAVGRYDRRQKWWLCRILLNASLRTHDSAVQQDPTLSREAGTASVSSPHQHASSSSSSTSGSCGFLVVSLAPHASDNCRLAVALLNGEVQVLSTHTKSIDGALPSSASADCEEEGKARSSCCGTARKLALEPFGHVFFRCSVACWLHGLAWSPSGEQLAVVGHDSTLHVWQLAPPPTPCAASPQPGSNHHTALRLRVLPLVQCIFAAEYRLVAAGFDGAVYVFAADAEGEWSLAAEGRAEETPARAAVGDTRDDVLSAQQRAFAFFESRSVAAAETATPQQVTKMTHAGTETLGPKSSGGAAGQGGPCVPSAPLHILLAVPEAQSSDAASFVSVSGDGRVQVLRVGDGR